MAGTCASALKLTMPVLVDDMRDTVATAYAAWPDRMFVLSADGRVVYAGGQGPWGFKVGDMTAALERELAK